MSLQNAVYIQSAHAAWCHVTVNIVLRIPPPHPPSLKFGWLRQMSKIRIPTCINYVAFLILFYNYYLHLACPWYGATT